MAADTIPCAACEGLGYHEVPGNNMAPDADSPEWMNVRCERCAGDREVSADWTEDQEAYVDGLESTIERLRDQVWRLSNPVAS